MAENQTEYVYFEGNYVPFDDAKISIKTHSFLYGTSIFEGIRGYYVPEKKSVSIFRMREHYDRIIANGKVCHLTPSQSAEELEQITKDLIQKNGWEKDTYIRPTIYKSGINITPRLDHNVTEICIWTQPLGEYLALDKGLNICVSSWRRLADNVIPPRAKAAGAYMNSALIVTDARAMGFDDAVVLTESGHVSEGSAMNLFLVKNGKLVTPATTENILEGITRDSIITIAKNELGLETEERVVDRTELYTADEAFFTGTGAQVSPITQFDNRPVGDGNIGPIAKKLQDLYFQVVKNKLPQYSHWCTEVALEPAKA
ncbi:MAG: branched-chain amino acid transaminase [Vampirovibrio sp.]|nr:branched-chain amino acid transaminase [Vampirovibrio sp.]